MKQQIIIPPSADTTVIDIETIATTSILPSPVNQKPVARAGSDVQIKLPENSVNLDGSLSSDPDGLIVAYTWSQLYGPSAKIESPNSSITKISELTEGSMGFKLIVKDNKGEESEDSLVITVLPAATNPVTIPIVTTPIPLSDPDLNAPGRGAEQWNNANEVDIPVAGVKTRRLDFYYRFQGYEFGTTKGAYNWSVFDAKINAAIDAGQKFSFGIMTCFSDAEVGRRQNYSGGGYGAVPEFVHMGMQAESVKDWKQPDGTWIPNWNSPFYLNWVFDRNFNLNKHINETSYKGVRYRDVIGYIDIRDYGQWGEWNSVNIVNNMSEYPAGTRATVASLKKIVDAYTQTFTDFPLVCMIAAFDANYVGVIMNPPEIADYILNTKNNWGPIGWRRDQWGSTEPYIAMLLEKNTRTYNGVPFAPRIMDRWKTSPIVGEPTGSSDNYASLEKQMKLYHATSFGNGNYMDDMDTAMQNNVRAASKAAGYRLQIDGGSVTIGDGVEIKLNWSNLDRSVSPAVNRAPTYENWDVVFRLVDQNGTVLWTGKSQFNPKRFYGTTSIVDKFPAAPTQAAALLVHIADPNNYRKPMPLYIKGAMQLGGVDNSYWVKLN